MIRTIFLILIEIRIWQATAFAFTINLIITCLTVPGANATRVKRAVKVTLGTGEQAGEVVIFSDFRFDVILMRLYLADFRKRDDFNTRTVCVNMREPRSGSWKIKLNGIVAVG